MLTETEARDLLQQAADTIEVGPAGPASAPSPRRPAAATVLVAAAAVLALVTGVLVWHAHRPTPADHPNGPVLVPSVFGYDAPDAEALLRRVGLTPRLTLVFTCRDVGRALGTDPAVGTPVPRGSVVALRTASDGDGVCLQNAEQRARDRAWALIDLAIGRGAEPTFARYLEIGMPATSPVTVPTATSGPAAWPACLLGGQGCVGTVLDVLARAAAATGVADGRAGTPRLVVARLPRSQWDLGFDGASALRFTIVESRAALAKPPWSIDEYVGRSGAVTGVALAWGTEAFDPRPPHGPPGVGPDPQHLGARFLAFARGSDVSLPIDTPVSLYLDDRLVRTLDPQQAARVASWSLCSRAVRSCLLSAPGAVTEMTLVGGGIVESTQVPARRRCLDTTSPPTDTGGDHVEVLDPAGRPPCRYATEVQLYANDVGQIVAVNVLTHRGSTTRNRP